MNNIIEITEDDLRHFADSNDDLESLIVLIDQYKLGNIDYKIMFDTITDRIYLQPTRVTFQ